MKEDSGDNLEAELSLLLGKVRIIMEKRKKKVEDLKREIEYIEKANETLETSISQMLKDFE
jgi:archaellum component FlaC